MNPIQQPEHTAAQGAARANEALRRSMTAEEWRTFNANANASRKSSSVRGTAQIVRETIRKTSGGQNGAPNLFA